ncbi:MAG: TOMM precursor leader peptide-binding protein, partial [Demequina sp.]
RWGDAAGHVDLDVIVAVGTAPATVTSPCMVDERPPLVVTTDDAGATVGPLVRPGQPACTQCVDLHHTDDDPWWPYLALQCGTPRRPWVAPAAIELVAGLAVKEIATHVAGIAVPGRQWRVANSPDLGDGLRPTLALPHSECGCGAAGPVGDEVTARRAHFDVVRRHK